MQLVRRSGEGQRNVMEKKEQHLPVRDREDAVETLEDIQVVFCWFSNPEKTLHVSWWLAGGGGVCLPLISVTQLQDSWACLLSLSLTCDSAAWCCRCRVTESLVMVSVSTGLVPRALVGALISRSLRVVFLGYLKGPSSSLSPAVSWWGGGWFLHSLPARLRVTALLVPGNLPPARPQ